MRLQVPALVLIVVMSGCLSAGPTPGPDERAARAPSGPVEVVPWGLEECRYVVAFGHVDGQRLVQYLPDGFTPRPSLPVPGVLGDTWFGFDVMTCASGRGLDGPVADMEYGYLWASADPPAGFLQDGVDASEHYAKWDVLVPDAPRREALQQRGVPVLDGSTALAIAGPSVEATLTLAGQGDFTIHALVTGQADPFNGRFAKISAATDGAAAWTAAATSGERGTGQAVLRFPVGSWAADVVAGTELVGQFHTGIWTYEESEIHFLNAEELLE